MIELTEQQRQAVAAMAEPMRLVDPATSKRYVLVQEEVYERLKDLLNMGPLVDDERRTILQGVWKRAGWDDPKMDEYDRLPPEQPCG